MSGRPAIVQDGPDVLMTVCVHPRASRDQVGTTIGSLDPQVPEAISIRLTASPVRGAANEACRTLLADLLRIAKSRILIVRGEMSRNKLLRVRDTDIASVLTRLKPSK